MDKPKVQIQSNSLRGDYMHEIADRTVTEIMADICPMLGPGASDAFIIKDGQPYYTRDGKEVMQSLTFDNELANYVHHIFFQAAYHQGQDVGDGSTTMICLYCEIYSIVRNIIRAYSGADEEDMSIADAIGGTDGIGDDTSLQMFQKNINYLRSSWKNVTDRIVTALKKRAVPLTEQRLLSMLYTCTQDEELTAKLYRNLKDAILAGAYIVPRKSNIATDLQTTAYNRPLFKVTRQFSLRPMEDKVDNAVIFYCNGMLDIAHSETLAGMASTLQYFNPADPSSVRYTTLVILCNGLTDTTRRTIKTFMKVIKANNLDVNSANNIAIYTLDEYRVFSPEEIEDIGTIITEEPGLGGIVQPITFETLLYRTFCNPATLKVEDLETLDVDTHLVDQMKTMFLHPYTLMFDDIAGMAIDKTLGPNAQARYDQLRKEIEEEKSSVKKHELNRRLRRTYGMFIDVEVGSTLLKDSQRKFELIMDALISSAHAAREGVLIGNSILHAIQCAHEASGYMLAEGNELNAIAPAEVIAYTLMNVFVQIVANYGGVDIKSMPADDLLGIYGNYNAAGQSVDKSPESFNLHGREYNFNIADVDMIWPDRQDAEDKPTDIITVSVENEDGTKTDLQIDTMITEPVNIMASIIENSLLPVELAKTDVFHISGAHGFLGNYIE